VQRAVGRASRPSGEKQAVSTGETPVPLFFVALLF